MSDEEPTPEEKALAAVRGKARWCYAHASRPEADADSLSDAEATEVAAIHDKVQAGEGRLDVLLLDFIAGRRKKLEEVKAVDAGEDQSLPGSE